MSNEQRQQQQHEPNRTHSPLVSSTIIRKEENGTDGNDGYEEGKQPRDRGEHSKAKEGESEKNVAQSQQQTCGSSKDDLCRKEKIKEYNSNKQQQQQIQHGPHRTHSPMVSSKKMHKEGNDRYKEGKHARDRGDCLKAKGGELEKGAVKSFVSLNDDLCGKEKNKKYLSITQRQHEPHRAHSPLASPNEIRIEGKNMYEERKQPLRKEEGAGKKLAEWVIAAERMSPSPASFPNHPSSSKQTRSRD
eukprot:9145882-Ditylum_brightwellii.AAC.1